MGVKKFDAWFSKQPKNTPFAQLHASWLREVCNSSEYSWLKSICLGIESFFPDMWEAKRHLINAELTDETGMSAFSEAIELSKLALKHYIKNYNKIGE